MKEIIILTAYFIGRVLFDAWRIKRGKNVDHWFNPAAFAIPAAGNFGNSPRNFLRGPGV